MKDSPSCPRIQGILSRFSCCRIWLMSLGATQPLKKRLRTSNPPATFGKTDGEIGLAVMGEVELFTLRPCQIGVYAPFLQVME